MMTNIKIRRNDNGVEIEFVAESKKKYPLVKQTLEAGMCNTQLYLDLAEFVALRTEMDRFINYQIANN